MKKILGSILCVIAVLFMLSKFGLQKPETKTENIQDWAVIAVLLTIGLPLSQAKKPSQDIPKE